MSNAIDSLDTQKLGVYLEAQLDGFKGIAGGVKIRRWSIQSHLPAICSKRQVRAAPQAAG